MAMREVFDTIRQAGADAALAERVYGDREFRSELRDRPEEAVRRFQLLTQRPVRQGVLRREIPLSWQLRLEPGRARPIH
jgi:hypothetical protein